MPFQDFDASGNDREDVVLARIKAMLKELYGVTANTASATSGAATCNGVNCTITSESLTTAAGSDYTLTLTNSAISTTSHLLVSVNLGTATTGEPSVSSVKPGAGTATILIRNIGSAALNGTISIAVSVR
jgi:hypothetical protein